MKYIRVTFVLGVFFLSPVVAEFQTDVIDPATGQPFQNDSNSGGLVGSTFNGARQDENQVTFDQNNNNNGREYKSNSAGNYGGTGAGAAIATGVSLISSGTAMLGFLPTVAPGTALIAMGILELAQAGADSNSQGLNNSQYELLTGNDQGHFNGTGSLSPDQRNQILADALNPATQRALQAAGINPLDFGNAVLNGQYNGPQDLSNFGFNSEQIASAQKAVDNAVGAFTPDSVDKILNEIPGADSIRANAKSGFTTGNNGKASQLTGGFLENGGGISLVTTDREKRAGLLRDAVTGKPSLGSGGDGGFYRNITTRGLASNNERNGGLSAEKRVALLQKGVLPGRKGMNIFMKAHQQFKSFSKWRGKGK